MSGGIPRLWVYYFNVIGRSLWILLAFCCPIRFHFLFELGMNKEFLLRKSSRHHCDMSAWPANISTWCKCVRCFIRGNDMNSNNSVSLLIDRHEGDRDFLCWVFQFNLFSYFPIFFSHFLGAIELFFSLFLSFSFFFSSSPANDYCCRCSLITGSRWMCLIPILRHFQIIKYDEWFRRWPRNREGDGQKVSWGQRYFGTHLFHFLSKAENHAT